MTQYHYGGSPGLVQNPGGNIPIGPDTYYYSNDYGATWHPTNGTARAAPVARSAPAPAPSSGGGRGGRSPDVAAWAPPPDYGLTGVNKINTSKFELDPWVDVEVPWDPLYLDQYEDWAKSGFINREVQPEDTVQWQMDQLLSKNGQYITSARQRGMEAAASRGLLNSSIAAGAAERSAIDAALPIAQQDASTYFSQGINNQNLANQFSLARQNAGMTGMMEMDKLKQGLEAEFAKFNAEMDLKVDSFNATMGFEEAMEKRRLAEAQKIALAQLWQAQEAAALGASTQLSVANIGAAAAADANYKSGVLSIISNGDASPQQTGVMLDQWNLVNGHATSSATKWDQEFR